VLVLQTYNEDTERRANIYNWCGAYSFRTDDERAVALAVHANSMREKSRSMRPDRRAEVLAEIDGALPMDDPMVAQALVDGFPAFHTRLLDRIWLTHCDAFTILRCSDCSRILKSPHAQQCIWCGADWHVRPS
jgi:hypothetical protein